MQKRRGGGGGGGVLAPIQTSKTYTLNAAKELQFGNAHKATVGIGAGAGCMHPRTSTAYILQLHHQRIPMTS